jgi:hypothetical protein
MAMTGKDELKRTVCDAIDRHGDEIIALGETILHHPETGFNEVKTAALIGSRQRHCRHFSVRFPPTRRTSPSKSRLQAGGCCRSMMRDCFANWARSPVRPIQ